MPTMKDMAPEKTPKQSGEATEALQSSRDWCLTYLSTDGSDTRAMNLLLEEIHSDRLDAHHIEDRISSLALQVKMDGRFCSSCQTMFANWPDLEDFTPVQWWLQQSTFVGIPGQAWNGTWNLRENIGYDPENFGLSRAPYRIVRSGCHTYQIEASMRRGCKFCTFLLHGLKHKCRLETLRKIEARLDKFSDGSECAMFVEYRRVNMTYRQIIRLSLPRKSCQSAHNAGGWQLFISSWLRDRPTVYYGATRNTIDVIAWWIRNCQENHDLCRAGAQSGLPSRLVAVHENPPRLVQTSGWSGPLRYATLSHSWGTCEFKKLTRDNLTTWMQRLPFNDLGNNFKDAISITRRLNIGYIWIDALCIIQDDDDDWEKEASSMYMVYSNSYLNIAASAAIDNSAGFFKEEPAPTTSIEAETLVRGRWQTRHFQWSWLYEEWVTDSHLATRAWALQEKILPPRTVHLATPGAFWECRELTATESVPDGFKPDKDDCLVARSGQQEGTTDYRWSNIAERYSAAKLTNEKDRLPALSGIASWYKDIIRDEYLAGMWRSNLRSELCWQHHGNLRKRPKWRAPTWSWLSVEGTVCVPGRSAWPDVSTQSEEYVQIIGAGTSLAGLDPCGQVSNGWLQLSCSSLLVGYLCRPTLRPARTPYHQVKVSYLTHPTHDETLFFVKDCLDDRERDFTVPVYLLPMKTSRHAILNNARDGWNVFSNIVGLILEREESDRGGFSRIGQFGTADPKHYRKDKSLLDNTGAYNPFWRLFDTHGRVEAKSVCESIAPANGEGRERYIISII